MLQFFVTIIWIIFLVLGAIGSIGSIVDEIRQGQKTISDALSENVKKLLIVEAIISGLIWGGYLLIVFLS